VISSSSGGIIGRIEGFNLFSSLEHDVDSLFSRPQVQTYTCSGNFAASNVVDGTLAARGCPDIYLSNSSNAFIEIILPNPSQVSSITIYNRSDNNFNSYLASGYCVYLYDSSGNELFVSSPLSSELSQTINVTGIASSYLNMNQFNVIPDKLFIGTSISGTSAATIQDCEASCSSTLECTGATYLSLGDANGDCILMKDGKINDLYQGMPSNGSWNAIENKTAKALDELNRMNTVLTDLNNEIMQLYQNNDFMKNEMSEVHETSRVLEENYRQLMEEKQKIAETQEVYNSVERQFGDEYTTVKQSSYQFYLWMVIAILATILAIKMYVF
jgi:hypothetical protein